MKKLTIVIFLLISIIVKPQYIDLIFQQQDQSFIISSEDINETTLGIYTGFFYKIEITNIPYIYRTPFLYFNRLGLTKGILNQSFVFNGGIKFISYETPYIQTFFEYGVKLHPIKLVTQNRNIIDFSLSINKSSSEFYGVGLSIPIR